MAYDDYPFGAAPQNILLAVWKKGSPIEDYEAAMWRRDICGHAMKFDQHGGEGQYGWEIDHINPRALGGKTTVDNLQPLWWSNNRKKSDTYPWDCE